MNADQLLTTSQVAHLFGVDRSTVNRWVKQGRIRAINTPGGQCRYRIADIDEASARSAPTPTASTPLHDTQQHA
jgi:excisionase family DNA binding protein